MKHTRTARILTAVGRKMKAEPPKILAKTLRKKGKKVAERQRVAILLSKAKALGARI